MGSSEETAVLYVHPDEGAVIEVDSLPKHGDIERLEAVTPGAAIDCLEECVVKCIVVDPAISAESLVSLLATVRGVAPTLPVLCAVTDGRMDGPEKAANTDLIERVVLGDAPIETLASRIESKIETQPRFPRAPADDYRQLFRKAPAPIVVYDADAVLRFANEAAARLVGLDDPEELRGRSVGEFVAETSREQVNDRMDRIIQQRQPAEPIVIELETVDGERRYVEAAGAPVTYRGEPGGQAVLNDVTERRRREQRLQTERDQFTALFEAIPEPVVHVRFADEDPVVVNVNETFEETFGYDSQQLQGKSLNDYIVPPDRQAEAKRLDVESITEREVERELTRETVDGPRQFLFRSVAFDTESETVEAISTYADITDQKHRERELEDKNEHLEAFANIVSHDLRNPLNVVSGRLELALETHKSQHFDAIERATERMETLIDDLLTLARQGETIDEMATVDLSEVVADAWTAVETSDGTLQAAAVNGTIGADPSRFSQLLENLFRNAVEHGSTNQADVVVRVGREDGCLYVEDDGPGIPEDERDSIFEVGYTTAEGGTGYGLAIVAEIVDAHGWTIDVTDGEDGGARFEICGIEHASTTP